MWVSQIQIYKLLQLLHEIFISRKLCGAFMYSASGCGGHEGYRDTGCILTTSPDAHTCAYILIAFPTNFKITLGIMLFFSQFLIMHMWLWHFFVTFTFLLNILHGISRLFSRVHIHSFFLGCTRDLRYMPQLFLLLLLCVIWFNNPTSFFPSTLNTLCSEFWEYLILC